MNIHITDCSNADFIKLAKAHDAELEERYGGLRKQYEEYNGIDCFNDVVLVYEDGIPAACGASREFNVRTVELRRIFVVDAYRGRGLAKIVVEELEKLAARKGYKSAVLETGVMQPEAIEFYKQCGYETIPNYGPYVLNENSVCMKKELPTYGDIHPDSLSSLSAVEEKA
jgi:GNAT superfamily N-acetyltransferase